MKKIAFLLILVLALVSCALDNSTTDVGYVRLSADRSRGVTASIDYPTLLDKTWTLQATKTDGGAATGAGTYEDIVLTDTLGPFSVGSWAFTITSTDGSISGTANTEIKAGNNAVVITVSSTASKGTLLIENCSFLESKIGAHVNYVDCYVDDNRVSGTDWAVSASMTEDGDLYVLPTLSLQLPGGIHTIRLYYGADNGGISSETISVRVVNGMTTHFSLGEQEGNLVVSVNFDVVEALV